MSISNLHTLLNRPWYIEQSYGASHLPLLFNILEGKNLNFKESKEESILTYVNLKGKNISVPAETSSFKNVAILTIKTPIVKHDQNCGPKGTKTMMRLLDELKSNESIAGIVLDIDSGGGQSYGTPEFYDYIATYPKPIVAYTDGFMCSAAYYIGSATKHIVANKRAEAIGSIGAFSQILDLTGYYEKQGAKLHTIYGTKSTEKNKSYREVLKGNYTDYIKQELDPLIETFISDMKSARQNIKEEVFQGGTFTGPVAKEMGLVDEVGTIQTAINKVFDLANTVNNSNKNNSKNNTMSKLNVPLIEAVIGSSFTEGETEEGIILTDEQALAIENRLAENTSTIEKATSEVTELNNNIKEMETKNTTVSASILKALNDAEVEGASEMTEQEGIEALSNLIVEYGSKDGATTTKTNNSLDNDEIVKEISGINIEAALNN